jgi:uncharacterized protein (TIRG00374 family)
LKKRNIIGLAISALLLYLAFRKVDFGLLGQSLSRAQYLWLIPSFILMMISLLFRAVRWKYLFRPISEARFSHLFTASAIGLMANNLLPARLGEFARAWVIGEKEGVSKTSSFATIVVERIFDGFTVLLFLVIALVFADLKIPVQFRKFTWIILAFYLAALGFLFLLRFNRRRALSIASFVMKPLPEKTSTRIGMVLDSFVKGLSILRSPFDMALAAILSILVWAPSIIILQLVLISFGYDLPIQASITTFIIVTMGIMIPSAPGFVGTVQYCTVLGLGLFGVNESEALGISIVYHATAFIPFTATGLICLAREGISFSGLRTVVREEGIGEDKDSSRPPL